MKRRFFVFTRTAHAWLGAVLSLLLVVLGTSGTLLVFKDDYLRASITEARAGVVPTPSRLAVIADAAQTRFGGKQLKSVVFAGPDLGITKVYLTSGERAYLNGKGELLTRWQGNAHLDEWIFDLHHHLLAGHTGEIVTGIAGLAATLLVVTGLVAFWPARRAFSFRIWLRSTARRDVLATHRNLGLLSAVPVLILALTGASMVFSSQTRVILSFLNEDTMAAPGRWVAGPGKIDWQQALHGAQAAFPGAQLRTANWPREPGSPATIRVKQTAEWHPNGRTLVLIDPATSQVIGVDDALAAPRADRVFNLLYPLHSARVGSGIPGRVYDIAVALGGIALSALGMLGIYAFLRRYPGRGVGLTRHVVPIAIVLLVLLVR